MCAAEFEGNKHRCICVFGVIHLFILCLCQRRIMINYQENVILSQPAPPASLPEKKYLMKKQKVLEV